MSLLGGLGLWIQNQSRVGSQHSGRAHVTAGLASPPEDQHHAESASSGGRGWVHSPAGSHSAVVHGKIRAGSGAELGPTEGGNGPGRGGNTGRSFCWRAEPVVLVHSSMGAGQFLQGFGALGRKSTHAGSSHPAKAPQHQGGQLRSVSHRPSFRVDSARPGCATLGMPWP